nr:unnamed protein product [Zea mays]
MAETNPELSDLMAQTNKKIVPKFTEIFPVEDVNYPYSAFIASVRKDVIKHCTDHKGIFQPVLPPEKKVPELWFYTELKTRTSSITLAIRMDNLYLVGFRTPGGVWWELARPATPTSSATTPGGSASAAGTRTSSATRVWRPSPWAARDDQGRQRPGEEEEDGDTGGGGGADADADAGGAELAAAAAAADPQADTKSKLVKLVVMVCEGLRFNTLSRTVDAGFNSQHGVTLTVTQGKQVQKWDRISKAAFEWADHPTAVIPDMQKLGIKNKNEAARIVALVKNQTTAAAAAATAASADNDDDEA